MSTSKESKERLKILTAYALRIITILFTIIFMILFCFIFLKARNDMLAPQNANGVVRTDIKWDNEYCKTHACNLQYITDKSKKIFDAGWIVLIGFVSSFLAWISNYLGHLSGVKEGRLLAENEFLKNSQKAEPTGD